jgi:hypothetical protein
MQQILHPATQQIQLDPGGEIKNCKTSAGIVSSPLQGRTERSTSRQTSGQNLVIGQGTVVKSTFTQGGRGANDKDR